MADRLLLGASLLFAAATALATAVSAREPGLPGEPLGLHVPGRVRTHLALGLGSGIAAPWPMPAIAVVAASRATRGARRPARTVATIGALVLAGVLVEPVTWGRRPASRLARATVPLHLACGALMVLAAAYRLWSHSSAAS